MDASYGSPACKFPGSTPHFQPHNVLPSAASKKLLKGGRLLCLLGSGNRRQIGNTKLG